MVKKDAVSDKKDTKMKKIFIITISTFVLFIGCVDDSSVNTESLLIALLDEGDLWEAVDLLNELEMEEEVSL